MDTYSQCIAWILGHFDFVMFLTAVVLIIVHRMLKRDLSDAEIVYRWIALFSLGFLGIFSFIMHAFYPEFTAKTIGWPNTPFQYEVAMADLALGVLGIVSFAASYGFRVATVLSATIFLWGDAIGHIYQLIKFHNFTPGNAGSWLAMDILIPLILILCLVRLKPGKLIVSTINLPK